MSDDVWLDVNGVRNIGIQGNNLCNIILRNSKFDDDPDHNRRRLSINNSVNVHVSVDVNSVGIRMKRLKPLTFIHLENITNLHLESIIYLREKQSQSPLVLVNGHFWLNFNFI
eukprot:344130_1